MDKFEEHIVVFIDFLGFKNFNQEKNIEEKMRFISFLQQIKNLDSDVVVEEVNNLKQFRLANSFYSDSLILAWPLNQPGLPVDRNVIQISVLPCIAQIAVRALCFGLLMRGAITVGEFYHKNGIFLGKALDNAHTLESEIAIYPRIIISTNIFERNLILTPQGENVPNCRKPWLKDFDHINYLNYLSIYSFRQAFWPSVPPYSVFPYVARDEMLLDEKVGEWITSSSKIINGNIDAFRSDDKKVKFLQKWGWFSNYFKNSITSLSEHESRTGSKMHFLV